MSPLRTTTPSPNFTFHIIIDTQYLWSSSNFINLLHTSANSCQCKFTTFCVRTDVVVITCWIVQRIHLKLKCQRRQTRTLTSLVTSSFHFLCINPFEIKIGGIISLHKFNPLETFFFSYENRLEERAH